MVPFRDYLKLHFLVFLWGFTAILGKLVTIPAVELVFYRTLMAAVAMALVLIAARIPLRVDRSVMLSLLLTGGMVAFHWITFFASARVSNVSVSLVGFATASLWAAFLEPLSQRRSIRWLEVLLGVVVVIGIAVIFAFDFHYKAGLFLGVLSGLLAAVFSVINARLVKKASPYVITFYEMTGACLSIALFFPLYVKLWAPAGLNLIPSGWDWISIAVLALVCTVYAFTVMVDLMRRISVFMIQLTINLEPVYGIVMAVILFGEKEKMDVSFYFGALIILSSVLSYPIIKDRFRKQAGNS